MSVVSGYVDYSRWPGDCLKRQFGAGRVEMENKVRVGGHNGKLAMDVNGELLSFSLNVVEAFMLLSGLCKNGANVTVDIEEPVHPRLAKFFNRGLNAKQVISEEKALRQAAELQEIERLEKSLAAGQATVRCIEEQLAQRRAGLATTAKSKLKK